MFLIYIFLGVIGLGWLSANDKLGVFVHGLGYLTAAVAILILIFFGCAFALVDFIMTSFGYGSLWAWLGMGS